jgi:ribonuclease J
MKFKIHRGTKEIGGSCVEVWTNNTRILIDIGMPLVEKDGSEFDYRNYKELSVKELILREVLPDIEGIYTDSDSNIDGVLISHAHYDHYGFSQYLHDDLEYYLGEDTYNLVKITTKFTPNTDNVKRTHFINNRFSFNIGDFKITPYLVDHSAFDAYAFLIEANGKSLFYSGDFRAHGRKSKLFDYFIKNPPKVDCLLMEGTALGRPPQILKTEDDIENELVSLFTEGKPNLIYTSGQNIDRLVSIYRACMRSNKIMVVDLYIAYILNRLAKTHPSIPAPKKSWDRLFVFYTSRLAQIIAVEDERLLFKFLNSKIEKEEINEKANDIVMIVRPYLENYFRKYMPAIEKGNFIYSMWEGYKYRNVTTFNFINFLIKERKFKQHYIHTSGHADLVTLNKLVIAIKPEFVVPIHTFEGNDYHKYFKVPVSVAIDGKKMSF